MLFLGEGDPQGGPTPADEQRLAALDRRVEQPVEIRAQLGGGDSHVRTLVAARTYAHRATRAGYRETVLLVALALAADTAQSVATMPTGSASERLAQAISAQGLPAEERAALAGLLPRLALALDEERTAAALSLVTTLPMAELGRARRGEAVIRAYGKWGEAESERVAALGKLLGVRGPLDTWVVKTEQAELVRVAVLKGKREATVALVAPPEWTAAGPFPVDASFENPRTLGIAWVVRTGSELVGIDDLPSVVFLDDQRVKGGSTSIRVTPPRKAAVTLAQPVAVAPGQALRVLVQGAGDGARGRVVLRFDEGGAEEGEWAVVDSGRFEPVDVSAVVPEGASLATIELATEGAGSFNWDDLRWAVGGEGGGSVVTERGPLRVRHPGTASPDISAASLELARAVGVLKLPPDLPVTVDVSCADLARCGLELWVRRAWGPPGGGTAAAQVIDAAMSRPSPLAGVLEARGAVGLKEAWQGR